MRITRITFIVCMALVSGKGYDLYGQSPIVSIHSLSDSIRLHPKPSLILISTGWCTFCQLQKALLKKHQHFQSAAPYIYFSELDAETREDITFNGKTYAFQNRGVNVGTHELAITLGYTDNRLAFPTWVLIDEHYRVIFRHPGIMNKNTLTDLLDRLRNAAPTQHGTPDIKP